MNDSDEDKASSTDASSSYTEKKPTVAVKPLEKEEKLVEAEKRKGENYLLVFNRFEAIKYFGSNLLNRMFGMNIICFSLKLIIL